jgi:hypothetical protein
MQVAAFEIIILQEKNNEAHRNFLVRKKKQTK